MKLAVLAHAQEPLSFQVYRKNVVSELRSIGVDTVPLIRAGPKPRDYDLVWDPGFGLNSLPKLIRWDGAPIVVTIHGGDVFSIPIHELARTWKDRVQVIIWKVMARRLSRYLGRRVSAAIAVSEYGARGVARGYGIPAGKVFPIHHGVDHGIFYPNGENSTRSRPYLLHVSAYAPKNNLDRISAAYARLPEASRPELLAVVPTQEGMAIDSAGVKLIPAELSQTKLAELYRNALGLVSPSLHETFGMPILEAMACGCPVITSNVTACPEVAGDAAILVDPRSVEEIASAMKRLVDDEILRVKLRDRGLSRARGFTWRRSAEEHLEVFKSVLDTTN